MRGQEDVGKSIIIQRVHIALSRVRTWLFAVPRLRAMVDANALLGGNSNFGLGQFVPE